MNAALDGAGQRLVRLRAIARLSEMAERGDFEEFVGTKATYRKRAQLDSGARGRIRLTSQAAARRLPWRHVRR